MSRHNLSAVDAIALMEEHADKALVLRGGEDAPPEDHELMTAFQKRTGKRLVRM
jgi:hypothetical protein